MMAATTSGASKLACASSESSAPRPRCPRARVVGAGGMEPRSLARDFTARADAGHPAREPANCLRHLAVDADDDPDEVHALEVLLPDDNRLHRGVGGLEPDAVALRVVALHRGLVVDHGDDDVAAAVLELLLHEDVVAVEDAVFDHRLALHAQREDLARLADEELVDVHGVLHVLDGEQRQTRGDASDDGNLDDVLEARVAAADAQRARCHRLGRAHGPQRARLEILALQVTLLLEGAQVIVHAVGRADAEVLPDLAQRRRVAALLDGLRDEAEDRLLAIGQYAARVVTNEGERAHETSRKKQPDRARTDRTEPLNIR